MSHSFVMPELDTATTAWIDQEAKRLGIPVEIIVRRLIYRGLEVERQAAQQQLHHDLDELAGTWSPEEATEFLRVVEDFNQIDSALWQ